MLKISGAIMMIKDLIISVLASLLIELNVMELPLRTGEDIFEFLLILFVMSYLILLCISMITDDGEEIVNDSEGIFITG